MDNCPACEREFKGIEDFPRIYVVNFQREEFPEAVGGGMRTCYTEKGGDYDVSGHDYSRIRTKKLPGEVLRLFRGTEKDLLVHDRILWEKENVEGLVDDVRTYFSSEDITSKVREVYESPALQTYLDSLEGFVGRELSSEDFLPTWRRDEGYPSVFWLPERYAIEFIDKDRDDNVVGVCDVSLLKTYPLWYGHNMMGGGRNPLVPLITLGTLTYEGRINTLQTTE